MMPMKLGIRPDELHEMLMNGSVDINDIDDYRVIGNWIDSMIDNWSTERDNLLEEIEQLERELGYR